MLFFSSSSFFFFFFFLVVVVVMVVAVVVVVGVFLGGWGWGVGGGYCKLATRIPVSNFGRNFPLSSDYRPFLAVETSSEESVNSSLARFI